MFRRLAEQKESRIEEGHLMPDHAHDDFDSAEVCGVAGDRVYQREERDSSGTSVRGAKAQFRRAALLGRGYFVSTVGRDEAVIREYDHSYYFIATFIKDNLRSHAANIVYSGAEAERR